MTYSWTRLLVMVFVGLTAIWAIKENVYAHQWSSAMGEARALERASRDMHKVIERTRDVYSARVSARLAESACGLVERLSRVACAEEVLASQSEVLLWFERIAATVDANPILKHDGRITAAMERTARHFNRLDEKVQASLWSNRNRRQVPLNPWDDPRFRQPVWLNSPAISPGDWHQSNVPGYVSPGSWHYSNVPGAISPGAWPDKTEL